MGRKKFVEADSRYLVPDHRYQSKLVSKFINCMMWDGKKSRSQQVFYDAMDIIAKQITDNTPIEVFETAIENVKPMLEVRSKRVGGASYQVPMQVRPKRQQSLAFRWILAAARGRKANPWLSAGLRTAGCVQREGAAMTTRENVHRLWLSQQAFAHFAW
jgi:small subunit ribosomal protein S7